MKSWSKTLEKTVQHFCTSAEYARDTAVTFLKNVDWKKVAIGVGAAVAIAGVTVLTGGSAVPVLIGAAVGAGSGAVINGGMAALQGGSVEDIAKAASDGFMWGGIGGAFGGSSGQFLAKAATSGSKVMSNPVVQQGLQGLADTGMETVQTIASGGDVSLGDFALSLVVNTVTAGDAGNTTQTVSKLKDGAEDVVDDLTDEVKDNFVETVQREVRDGDTLPPVKYSPVNPGPLKEDVANTFNGAVYTEQVLTENTVMYRVNGNKANKVGPYMSRTPQNGGLQSQLDLALNPAWGNTAENITKVVVPKGTTIYEGVAAPQNIYDSLGNVIGTLQGGGNQVYIPIVKEGWFQ